MHDTWRIAVDTPSLIEDLNDKRELVDRNLDEVISRLADRYEISMNAVARQFNDCLGVVRSLSGHQIGRELTESAS